MRAVPADECYRPLVAQDSGRIGVDVEHYPLILPVDHGLAGAALVRPPPRHHPPNSAPRSGSPAIVPGELPHRWMRTPGP